MPEIIIDTDELFDRLKPETVIPMRRFAEALKSKVAIILPIIRPVFKIMVVNSKPKFDELIYDYYQWKTKPFYHRIIIFDEYSDNLEHFITSGPLAKRDIQNRNRI